MSKEATLWLQRQDIPDPSLMAVLRVLTYMHHRESLLFPSQRLLSKRTALCERTVRGALRVLDALGVTTRRPRSAGHGKGRTSDVIELTLNKKFELTKLDIREIRDWFRQGSTHLDTDLQPASRALTTGTTCRGIVLSSKNPSQGITFGTNELRPSPLRVIKGGKDG